MHWAERVGYALVKTAAPVARMPSPRAPANGYSYGSKPLMPSFKDTQDVAGRFESLTGSKLPFAPAGSSNSGGMGPSPLSSVGGQASGANGPPAASPGSPPAPASSGNSSWLGNTAKSTGNFLLNYGTPYGMLSDPRSIPGMMAAGGISSGFLTDPLIKATAGRFAPEFAKNFGASQLGQFVKSPGALTNAWNFGRSLTPWAAGGTAPANVFAGLGGGAAGGAGGAAGGTTAAGLAGTAGTAAGALYGAYALGDVPYAAYEVYNDPQLLERRQQAQAQAWRDSGGLGGYLQNVGGNLARPGLAFLDMFRNSFQTGQGLRRGLQGTSQQNVDLRNQTYAKELANYDQRIAAAQAAGDAKQLEFLQGAKARTLAAQGKNNSGFRWWYGY